MSHDNDQPFVWALDASARGNIDRLAAKLADCPDVYRHPRAHGLVVGTRDYHIEVTSPEDLQAIVYDRFAVRVCKTDKDGELVPTGRLIPGGHLSVLLRSERCLSRFRAFPDLMARVIADLGAARPETELTPAQWADVADQIGLALRLHLPSDEMEREQAMGRLLSAYRDRTLETQIDGETIRLRIQRRRSRQHAAVPGNAAKIYWFAVVDGEDSCLSPENI